jgi:hypothetical protein
LDTHFQHGRNGVYSAKVSPRLPIDNPVDNIQNF